MTKKNLLRLLIFIPLRLAEASTCTTDPFLQELKSAGDNFRSVSLLKQKEFELRSFHTEGFICARMLLQMYLQHQEYEAADAWLAKIFLHYPTLSSTFGNYTVLSAELAYTFENFQEVFIRLKDIPETPAIQTLKVFSKKAEKPFSEEPQNCATPECIQLQTLMDKEKPYPLKSPGLSLILGIIPGCGQIYAGHLLSGIATFILNGALFAITGYAYARNERAFAMMSTVATVGIYGSSIYAGYEATVRANEQQEMRLRSKIQAIPLSLQLFALSF